MIFRIIFNVIIFQFGFACHISAVTVSELQEGILGAYGELESVKFEFVQVTSSSLTSETRASDGIVYFKKPKFLRMEQKAPELQIVVGDGKNVTVSTPRFKQAVVDSWEYWVEGNLLLLCLSGHPKSLQKIREEYLWKVEEPSSEISASQWVVHLTPVNGKIGVGRVRLWVNREDFILTKVVWEQSSMHVETVISNLEKNPRLEPKLFKFVKGSDTKIYYAQ